MCNDYDSAGFIYKIKSRLLMQQFGISAAENITTHVDICDVFRCVCVKVYMIGKGKEISKGSKSFLYDKEYSIEIL